MCNEERGEAKGGTSFLHVGPMEKKKDSVIIHDQQSVFIIYLNKNGQSNTFTSMKPKEKCVWCEVCSWNKHYWFLLLNELWDLIISNEPSG